MFWSPFGGALLPILNKHGVAPNENFNLCIAMACITKNNTALFIVQLYLVSLLLNTAIAIMN
ncbi:hypothetical protein OTT_0684 [Orientia tsutsugamushi str. Ikeda]|uniref:Uncharacterized protein n=1 Tax=Orientia tsutsugamushi (strain Ikeda) TaxID=334380 RepID=B3CRX2_ORITI|nr:hypothetical protein OTT_0684 [Orientia tsutsugamushi str. Ikeda]